MESGGQCREQGVEVEELRPVCGVTVTLNLVLNPDGGREPCVTTTIKAQIILGIYLGLGAQLWSRWYHVCSQPHTGTSQNPPGRGC